MNVQKKLDRFLKNKTNKFQKKNKLLYINNEFADDEPKVVK